MGMRRLGLFKPVERLFGFTESVVCEGHFESERLVILLDLIRTYGLFKQS